MRKSIALDPASASRAYNYIGYMWLDADKNIDQAGEFIRKALEAEPDNAAYLDSLGWYYYKKGEYEQARTELLKAAQMLEPEDPVVFEHIGDTCAKLGDTAQALIYWQKAAALDGVNADVAEKIEQAKKKLAALPDTNRDDKPVVPPGQP